MGKKKGTPTADATDETPVSATALGDGKILLRAWKGVRLSGPPSTYTSTDFGHDLSVVVEDDEAVVASKAEDMRLLIKMLNNDARDGAYEELCDHINAVNARKFRDQ